MQNQIELPLRGGRKVCASGRRNRRVQWARLWFARMHEVVEEAEERTPTDVREVKEKEAQPAGPETALNKDQESSQSSTTQNPATT